MKSAAHFNGVHDVFGPEMSRNSGQNFDREIDDRFRQCQSFGVFFVRLFHVLAGFFVGVFSGGAG